MLSLVSGMTLSFYWIDQLIFVLLKCDNEDYNSFHYHILKTDHKWSFYAIENVHFNTSEQSRKKIHLNCNHSPDIQQWRWMNVHETADEYEHNGYTQPCFLPNL